MHKMQEAAITRAQFRPGWCHRFKTIGFSSSRRLRGPEIPKMARVRCPSESQGE